MHTTPDDISRVDELVMHTAAIVASYVGNNAVDPDDVCKLIAETHKALLGISAPPLAEEATRVPAVPIRKSIFPDYLVCLEDGLKFKTLRRHLATLGLTPQEYRTKWRLPEDYPMVAPKYAARRSELAKTTGLGAKGRAAKAAMG